MLNKMSHISVKFKISNEWINRKMLSTVTILMQIFSIPMLGQIVIGYNISGRVTLGGSGLSGVTITANGTGNHSGFWDSDTTDNQGRYSIHVPDGFTGNLSPYKSGYTFNPPDKDYTNPVMSDRTLNFTATPIDTSPPQPNPMTWAKVPYQTSTTSISMEADVATDETTPVRYYFDYVNSPTGGPGGTDSSWTTNRSYTDTGLGINHQYSYRVRARDSASPSNEGSYSEISSAYTDIEKPAGIKFGTITTNSIRVESSNTPSGLSRGSSGLYIENITRGTNSGWRQNNSGWNSSGLSANTRYGFRARTRNGDGDETDNCPAEYRYTHANVPRTGPFADISTNSIRITWTSDGNPSNTKYLCENIKNGTNSGWIQSTFWTNTGLIPNTTYSYQVKARNGNNVETAWINLGSESTKPISHIIYVDKNATGVNNGLNWADAYNYLQYALGAASDEDEIRVAEGIYKPDEGLAVTRGDREASFELKNGVTVKGGFAGLGHPDPNTRDITLYETILSGDLNSDDVSVIDPCDLWNEPSRAENSYNVVMAEDVNETAIIDGFTITAGNADEGGGGMLIWYGDPTVRNCTLVTNSAGGMSPDSHTFWGRGGAISCTGGKPVISECIIVGNCAVGAGGGVRFRHSGGRLLNCSISGNSSYLGGGMDIYGSYTLVNNCFLSGNVASYGGGVNNWASTLTLTNCVLSGNESINGAAVRNDDSLLKLVNCTLVDNFSNQGIVHITEAGSGIEPSLFELANCILWNDGNEIWNDNGSQLQINYCNIQGGQTSVFDPLGGLIWGIGNINADPLFVRSGYWESNGTPNNTVDDFWVNGDYHLLSNSPCIDTGDNTALPSDVNDLDGDGDVMEPLPFDLDGRPRIGNGIVDMGAFEITSLNPVYNLEQLINDIIVLNQ